MLACLAPMLGGLLTASGAERSAISCGFVRFLDSSSVSELWKWIEF